MSLEKVRKYLKNYNMDDRIIELDSSSATVLLASKALNCKEDEIAKTLSFKLKDNSYILIVMSGESRLSNKKFKNTFNSKASMIQSSEVEKIIGHAPGGVCPFSINNDVKIYLDNSLKKHKYIYPACGSSNTAIKLSINELEKIINFCAWVDVVD